MISLKNKGLKSREGPKLCKSHKMRKPYVCRNGKVKLNMTKAVTSRNFKLLRQRKRVNYAQNKISAEKAGRLR